MIRKLILVIFSLVFFACQSEPTPTTDQEIKGGLTYWLGCKKGPDIQSVTSCQTRDDACSSIGKFVTYAKGKIIECAGQGNTPAIWVEADGSSISEVMLHAWIVAAKDILTFMRSNSYDSSVIETSLNKLVLAIASIEKRM